MSKIGKQELTIPSGVTISINENVISVKGPKGEVSRKLNLSNVKINVNEDKITFTKLGQDKKASQNWGTVASHIKNMIKGVQESFTKKLIIEGVGYKWEVKGSDLQLALGFSHPVLLKIPSGLNVKADKANLEINGIDKELVSTFAKDVRALKEPEPYKGKGIRYETEVIRRKQGKRSA